MIDVRRDVIAATGGDQIPWDQSALTEPMFLAGKPRKPAPAPAITIPQKQTRPPLSEAATVWAQIRSLSDEAVLRAFAKQYDGTVQALLAERRIAEVQAEIAQRTAALIASREAERKAAREAAEQRLAQEAAQQKQAERKRVAAIAAERAQAEREAKRQAEALAETERTRRRVEQEARVAALSKPEVEAETALLEKQRQLATSMQSQLKRLGCYTGKIDGDFGRQSKAAMRRLKLGDTVSQSQLTALERRKVGCTSTPARTASTNAAEAGTTGRGRSAAAKRCRYKAKVNWANHPRRFGAMAVGDKNCGASWNWKFRSAAVDRAMAECRRRTKNCRIVQVYRPR